MAINLTYNYGLKKPEKNEFFDVQHQNDNMDKVDECLKDNADTMLKKDGSVQMSGPLRTVGGNSLASKQLDFSTSSVYTDDVNNRFTIVTNCYHDGIVWRYLKDGKAATFIVDSLNQNNILRGYYAVEGVKGGVITWIENSPLTALTGLPLTGGTLTGSVTQTSGYIYQRNNNINIAALGSTQNDTQLLALKNANGLPDWNNSRGIALRNINFSLDQTLMLSATTNGVSTLYKVYGEHNITVSTVVPSTALAEGAQHQVY